MMLKRWELRSVPPPTVILGSLGNWNLNCWKVAVSQLCGFLSKFCAGQALSGRGALVTAVLWASFDLDE